MAFHRMNPTFESGLVPRSSRWTSRYASAALLGCLLTLASSGHAEEDRTEAARLQYRQALEAKHAKDWEEARELLLELWEQARTYDVAGTLGEVEHKLGNPAAAAQYFAFALAHLPPREKADTVEQLRRALRAMKEQVATVRFELHPKEADVRIDGRPLDFGPLPEEVYVLPGERTFAAVLGTGRTFERLEVAAGKEYHVVLRLDSADPAHQPSATEPASEPSAPSQTTPTPPPPAVPQDSGSNKSLVPVYVGAGLTVVGLGAWIGFGIDAGNAKADIAGFRKHLGESSCSSSGSSSPECQAMREALERNQRNGVLGRVGMGVTIGAAAATLAYWLFWPAPKGRETAATLHPTFAADRSGGTIGLTGEF